MSSKPLRPPVLQSPAALPAANHQTENKTAKSNQSNTTAAAPSTNAGEMKKSPSANPNPQSKSDSSPSFSVSSPPNPNPIVTAAQNGKKIFYKEKHPLALSSAPASAPSSNGSAAHSSPASKDVDSHVVHSPQPKAKQKFKEKFDKTNKNEEKQKANNEPLASLASAPSTVSAPVPSAVPFPVSAPISEPVVASVPASNGVPPSESGFQAKKNKKKEKPKKLQITPQSISQPVADSAASPDSTVAAAPPVNVTSPNSFPPLPSAASPAAPIADSKSAKLSSAWEKSGSLPVSESTVAPKPLHNKANKPNNQQKAVNLPKQWLPKEEYLKLKKAQMEAKAAAKAQQAAIDTAQHETAPSQIAAAAPVAHNPAPASAPAPAPVSVPAPVSAPLSSPAVAVSSAVSVSAVSLVDSRASSARSSVSRSLDSEPELSQVSDVDGDSFSSVDELDLSNSSDATATQPPSASSRKSSHSRSSLSLASPAVGLISMLTSDIFSSSGRKFSPLHQEIVQVSRLMGPRKQDGLARRLVLQRVSNVIFDLWDAVEVHVIGSCATDLFLPDSDLDLVVRNPKSKPPLSIKDLYVLGGALQPLASSMNIISTASVPLIKLTDKDSTFTVDITLNVDTGLYSTSLIIKYLNKFPSLRPLTIILKQFLKARGLNELYSGGLPSYTLILLIVGFLQFHRPSEAHNDYDEERELSMKISERGGANQGSASNSPILRGLSSEPSLTEDESVTEQKIAELNRMKKQNELIPLDSDPDLGHYLLSFFEFYGKLFPFSSVGISLRHGGSFFSKRSRRWLHSHNPDLLSLENPLDEANDLGFKVFRIGEIRQAFAEAYDTLSANPANVEDFHTAATTLNHSRSSSLSSSGPSSSRSNSTSAPSMGGSILTRPSASNPQPVNINSGLFQPTPMPGSAILTQLQRPFSPRHQPQPQPLAKSSQAKSPSPSASSASPNYSAAPSPVTPVTSTTSPAAVLSKEPTPTSTPAPVAALPSPAAVADAIKTARRSPPAEKPKKAPEPTMAQPKPSQAPKPANKQKLVKPPAVNSPLAKPTMEAELPRQPETAPATTPAAAPASASVINAAMPSPSTVSAADNVSSSSSAAAVPSSAPVTTAPASAPAPSVPSALAPPSADTAAFSSSAAPSSTAISSGPASVSAYASTASSSSSSSTPVPTSPAAPSSAPAVSSPQSQPLPGSVPSSKPTVPPMIHSRSHAQSQTQKLQSPPSQPSSPPQVQPEPQAAPAAASGSALDPSSVAPRGSVSESDVKAVSPSHGESLSAAVALASLQPVDLNSHSQSQPSQSLSSASNTPFLLSSHSAASSVGPVLPAVSPLPSLSVSPHPIVQQAPLLSPQSQGQTQQLAIPAQPVSPAIPAAHPAQYSGPIPLLNQSPWFPSGGAPGSAFSNGPVYDGFDGSVSVPVQVSNQPVPAQTQHYFDPQQVHLLQMAAMQSQDPAYFAQQANYSQAQAAAAAYAQFPYQMAQQYQNPAAALLYRQAVAQGQPAHPGGFYGQPHFQMAMDPRFHAQYRQAQFMQQRQQEFAEQENGQYAMEQGDQNNIEQEQLESGSEQIDQGQSAGIELDPQDPNASMNAFESFAAALLSSARALPQQPPQQ